jgi:hypothetical protein
MADNLPGTRESFDQYDKSFGAIVAGRTRALMADAGLDDARSYPFLKTISSYFQRSGIYVFLISFACLFYLMNAPLLLAHYDLGWHLAAGDLIRDQSNIPFHDPWSFTSAGRQWFNLSWLWDVLASVLFQHTNFGGLTLFAVACGAVIAGYLTSVCLSSGASPIAVCISVFAACLLYPAFAAAYPNIYLAVSPNISTMLFSVIFYGECLKRTQRVFWLPAVMVLWANLHGGFLLGLIIISVSCGVALLRWDRANFRIYSFVLAACFIATFINPLGWHIYQGLATVLGHFSQAYITEWWPYYRNIAVPGSIPGIVYILMFVAFELRYRGLRPLEPRLLSWLFLFLGLYQFRYISFLCSRRSRWLSTLIGCCLNNRITFESKDRYWQPASLRRARCRWSICTSSRLLPFRNCCQSKTLFFFKRIFRRRGC